jgi:hypothetical protein
MVGEGPKISLASRYDPKSGDTRDNPGPGAYEITSQISNDSIKYTLHQRTNDLTTGQITSPGPAACTPDYMPTKRTAPISTLHVRPGDHSLYVTPGASDYVIDCGLVGLQPKMHQRIEPKY